MTVSLPKKQIIILGGGFAGVKCAATLERLLPSDQVTVTLFNLENHLVFTPLLADVVGASVNPLDVVVPLRQMLPGVLCRTEEIIDVDLVNSEVEYFGEDGQRSRLRYDHLVLACGNVPNLNIVPGMADHAIPLKNIADAVSLRSHVMEQMEKAETSADPERRRWHLSFVVVGGGYSGVEAAGEINDLVRGSARYFHNFSARDVSVALIQSRDHILPEINHTLREFARRKMEKAGVKILLNAKVMSVSVGGVTLQDGKVIRGGTVVCTIGSSTARVVERLQAPKVKGRLVTDPDMRVRGLANVWAIGDCALVMNDFNGQPSPPTGQFAERQGRRCAKNIANLLRGRTTEPFLFKPFGQLCAIGHRSAVAEFLGIRVSGFVAWFIWRSVYLFKLPAWTRRLQVGFDWAWLLMFPRDLAHVRARQTDRVSHAHYQAGDLIIRQGEVPSNFYVVKSGEVEIIRACASGTHEAEVISILGPNSFFGEKALLGHEPVDFSVRARTPTEVLAMGRNVFTQVSNSLAPMRDALAQALNRRSFDLWKMFPAVHALLKGVPVRELMDPLPEPLFQRVATMGDVADAFVEQPYEVFYVCGDDRSLEGVVTLRDWLRALSSGSGPESPVSELMVKNPISLVADDDAAIAVNVLREYRLKSVPIVEGRDKRRLVGCLRVRHLMAYVFARLGTRGQTVRAAR